MAMYTGMLSVVMLNVICSQCFTLNITNEQIMLNVIILSAVMLSVIMLNGVVPSKHIEG
jgi:hypothetical protein